MKAIRKELPALILTLQDLYEISGDAEAFGIQSILSSFGGVAAVVFLREILNLLASLNCYMQRKTADFSRLQIILESIIKSFKQEDASWCSEVGKATSCLQNEHGITVETTVGVTRHASREAN